MTQELLTFTLGIIVVVVVTLAFTHSPKYETSWSFQALSTVMSVHVAPPAWPLFMLTNPPNNHSEAL